MSRKERRAAAANARKSKVEPVTAYHEAGHAVARLMTAALMGYKPEDAVHSIEINPGTSNISVDGRMRLVSQAICMGPMVSAPLQRAVSEAVELKQGISPEVIWEAFALCGTAEDREISMRSRMLIDVMGAAAEARFTGETDLTSLFASYACEDDRADFIRNSKVLGIGMEEALNAETIFLRHSQMLVQRPIIWSAIDAVAKRLRATMPGRQVWQLAWPILAVDVDAIERPLPGQKLIAGL